MAEDMKNAMLTWLLHQSPAIIVLLGMSYVLWTQNERSHEENKACNQEIVRVYQTQNTQMIEALKDIKHYMELQTAKTKK